MEAEVYDRIRLALEPRYGIARELGRGGMATVYLGYDVKHEREVAIKVLHPEIAASIGSERFEREIRLAAKLQHPHILGLYESGDADGLLYYVMPFVKGESLRDRLERESMLPIDDAIQIVLEVADALGHAHGQGIIHRDIKPENILLSNGHALVADFGIAKAATEGGGAKLTQTGMALGTPVYMAPEQAMGESVGPTADIYSMGCMLYEMLAGEPPFTGPSAHAILARHAMENVPSIRIIRPSVPEEVEDAIFATMAKTPADRPQTAAKFAEFFGVPAGSTATRRAALRHTASRRIPTNASMAALPGTIPDHAPVSVWRRSRVLAVAGGAVVLIAVALTAWRLMAARSTRTANALDPTLKRVAVLYFADRSPDQRFRPVADGLTEALIKTLGEVRSITVISKNGVEPFRGTEVGADSIARAVNVGTIVEGTVEPAGTDKVRISTLLRDRSGADVAKRASFVISSDNLFAAEDSVAREVSQTLREWLGQEVELRERRSGTQSAAAWNLLRQAEGLRRDADRAAASEPAKSMKLLEQGDSILVRAQAADDRWVEPIVFRGALADLRANLLQDEDKEAASRVIDSGMAWVGRALTLDSRNAPALELRGRLKLRQWRLGLSTDPNARAALLKDAKADLTAATLADPSLASAYATLSVADYWETPADVFSALSHARAAYEADAFLTNSDVVLDRLFLSAYDTENFAEAIKWCNEGVRRFPKDFRFVQCRLWLQLVPTQEPDIPGAWALSGRMDSLATGADSAFLSHLGRQIVGGVIGRAAAGVTGPAKQTLIDSANKVLIAARAGREVDRELELPGYEAVMRVRMGDQAAALNLLKQYVAQNPTHSFEVAGNIHWWWRELQSNPGFQSLIRARK